MTPDFDALRTFVAVVDAGGFAEAARRLNISRSMVSRRVAQLEDDLGAHLLLRNARTMALTEAGDRFHGRCRQLLAELESACEDVGGDASGTSGLLRVSAPYAIGQALVAPIVAQLVRDHPRLRFEMQLDEDRLDLVAQGIDVAVRAGSLADSQLVARRLGVLRGWIGASPDYLRQHGVPARPADLAGHTLLGHTHVGSADLWAFEDDGAALRPDAGVTALPPRRVRVNDLSSLLELARHGAGLAVLPPFLGRAEVARGELVPVLQGYPLQSHELQALTTRLSARTRLFVETLSRYAARPPEAWGAAP